MKRLDAENVMASAELLRKSMLVRHRLIAQEQTIQFN
jgi:hypothetical protein